MLILLALVDMVLVGSLIVMVMFSGYENFVSALDVDTGGEKLSWLGKLDANSLKLKVASSIVAISSIHLLRAFMKAPDYIDDGQQRYADVVRDHPSHVRGLGRDDGRARPHHVEPAPRSQRRGVTSTSDSVQVGLQPDTFCSGSCPAGTNSIDTEFRQ